DVDCGGAVAGAAEAASFCLKAGQGLGARGWGLGKSACFCSRPLWKGAGGFALAFRVAKKLAVEAAQGSRLPPLLRDRASITLPELVIPAKAGIQWRRRCALAGRGKAEARLAAGFWIPAFAGMTVCWRRRYRVGWVMEKQKPALRRALDPRFRGDDDLLAPTLSRWLANRHLILPSL